MSRVYQNPSSTTARRASLGPPPLPSSTSTTRGARAPVRPTLPPTSTTRGARAPVRPTLPPTSTTRGVRAPIPGRTMHTQPPQQERNDDNEVNRTNQQERTTHVGDGYHMLTPSITKREQMRRQAENEQRLYEAHIERTRLRDIHEVNRLGGDELSEDEVRRRQAEKYRREKFTRLEKTHQDQINKKQEEERDIEAKKQAARLQSMENEKRDRNAQLRSMRPSVNQYEQGATGWTDDAREDDRRKKTDQFLNRLTQQYDDMNISSDENEKKNHHNLSKSEKLSILRETLPHIDDQTFEHYLEIYDGNIDTVVHELLR